MREALSFGLALTVGQFNDTLTLGHFAGRTTASLLGYQGQETTLSRLTNL
jgi:hypothetical protein